MGGVCGIGSIKGRLSPIESLQGALSMPVGGTYFTVYIRLSLSGKYLHLFKRYQLVIRHSIHAPLKDLGKAVTPSPETYSL